MEIFHNQNILLLETVPLKIYHNIPYPYLFYSYIIVENDASTAHNVYDPIRMGGLRNANETGCDFN